MGVSFYNCFKCNRIFNDCGYFVTCNEDGHGCGKRWCSKECAEQDGYMQGECAIGSDKFNRICISHKGEYCDSDCEHYVKESCIHCRIETIEDDEILEYALRLLNKSKEDLIFEIKNK